MEQNQKQNEVLTLKEVILTFASFLKEWLFKFWIILPLAYLGGKYQYDKVKDTPSITYLSKISFMLNEASSGGTNQALSLLSKELGLGGGGGGSATPSEKKLIELLRTRKLITMTLFKKIDATDGSDYYINYFQKHIPAADSLGFYNFTSTNIENFTREENDKLNKIVNKLSKMLAVVPSQSGILNISMECVDETFCKYFTEEHLKTLTEFYFTKTSDKLSTNFTQLQSKADSIHTILRSKESQLAEAQDRNRLSVKAETHLIELQLRRDIGILNAMYTEAVKNLELTKYNLSGQTAMFQLIDTPTFPLPKKYFGVKKYTAIGALVGFAIGILLVSLYKIIRDALRS